MLSPKKAKSYLHLVGNDDVQVDSEGNQNLQLYQQPHYIIAFIRGIESNYKHCICLGVQILLLTLHNDIR